MTLSEISTNSHAKSSHDPLGVYIVAHDGEREQLVCKETLWLHMWLHKQGVPHSDMPLLNWTYLRNATAEDVERLMVK